MKFLLIFLGLTTGNFIYACFNKDFHSAFERSFFQGLALALAWWLT